MVEGFVENVSFESAVRESRLCVLCSKRSVVDTNLDVSRLHCQSLIQNDLAHNSQQAPYSKQHVSIIYLNITGVITHADDSPIVASVCVCDSVCTIKPK